MKRLAGHFFVMTVAAFIVIGCSNVNDPALDDNSEYSAISALTNGDGIPASSAAVNLVAGRTENIGEVNCWIRGNKLFVLYSTYMNWKLAETQLAVAGSVIDIERTKNGNPKIGHFPWKMEHESPVDEYLYSIALDELGFDHSGEMIIAAHAAVLLYSEDGAVEREEGAWAYGERFVSMETQVKIYPDRIEMHEDSKDTGEWVILEKESVDKGNWSMYFTVVGWQITVRELTINEIYYCGGDYSKFYFYDQFVELYNASEDTLYLDGCILTRNMPSIDPDIEWIDHVRAIYAFQFPGTPVTGREYPIYPGQHVIVAADAIDHSQWANAIDLSGADWEFFNPLGSDYDNPDVPNVVSIHPDSRTDFMINLVHNAVVFATGEEYAFESYINSAGYERIRVTLPLYTVIDGVEYAPNADRTKELTVRVDAGFAGLGCTKFSGQSTERREIGLDVNNSTFDFILISTPTPGSQH